MALIAPWEPPACFQGIDEDYIPASKRPSSTLVFQPHPLMPAGRGLYEATVQPGESLLAFLERLLPDVALRDPRLVWVAAIGERRVPRGMWARTFPKPGMIVTLTAAVHGGGGGGGKNPLQSVLSIGLMLIAPGIGGAIANAFGFGATNVAFGGFFGAELLWGKVFGGLVSVLGNALISRIFTPDQPALAEASGRGPFSGGNVSPTYSLSGGSNRARPYSPMPLVLGRHIIFPDYGAKFYTEFVGDDQYLYQVFHFGFAPLTLSDFKIGSTPIASFTDVTIEESGDDGALDLFPANVDTVSGGVLTSSAGWLTRTSSIDATAIAVEIGGDLYAINPDGIGRREVDIDVEYRAVGAGTWLPFVDAGSTIRLGNASRKGLRVTYRRELVRGQYEVRVRRVTADETRDDLVSNLTWTQLRTYQPDLADYTGQKRVAVRIKASGQLNGQLEQFNAIASRPIEVWNGAAWVTEASSNPAYLARHFAKGARIAGKVAYGGDLQDAQLDEANIQAFGAWCVAKNLTFNGVIDTPRSVAEVIDLIARCGRGRKSYPNGKLAFVWDVPNQPAVAVFGLGNIRRDSFEVEYFSGNVPEQVVCRFVNPDRDWQQDEVRATVPGVTTPSEVATMEIFGCCDQDMAGRETALAAGAYSTQLRRISFETDTEGTVVTGGDVAVLAHDLTQWGYSGRLVSGTGTVLTLDAPVPFTAGLAHYVRIVAPNGYHTIKDVVYQAGSSATITLTSALPATDGQGNNIYTPDTDPKHPACDWQWAFEPRATPGKLVKVIGCEPRRGGWRFTVVDEEESYYAGEYGAWEGSTSTAAEGPILSGLQVSESLYNAGSVFQVRLALLWDVLGDYELAIVRAGVNGDALEERTRTYGRRAELTVPASGTIDIEVVGYGPGGATGTRSKLTYTGYVIQGKDYPPPTVTGFAIDGDTLRWNPVSAADLAGYEIRFHTGSNTSWADGTPLYNGLITESPYKMQPRPAGPLTLMIRAVDTSFPPNYSTESATIITDLGDASVANVVASTDFEAEGWPGTITDGTIVATDIVADSTTLMFEGDPDSLMFTGSGSDLMFTPSEYAALVYQTIPVFARGVRAGSTLTLPNTVTAGTLSIDYRASGADAMFDGSGSDLMFTGAGTDLMFPITEPWQGWPGAILASRANYEFRITCGAGVTQGVIDHLVAQFDVPDVEEALGDVAIAAIGTRLPIVRDYDVIQSVTLTLRSDGGTARRIEVVDHDVAVGPLVMAYDAANAATTALVDARIKGYLKGP